MIYTYECIEHGEFDVIKSLSELSKWHPCPKCKKNGHRVITVGSGGLHTDENAQKWLPDACMTLLPDGHRPIETRAEFKRYLKDNHISERS